MQQLDAARVHEVQGAQVEHDAGAGVAVLVEALLELRAARLVELAGRGEGDDLPVVGLVDPHVTSTVEASGVGCDTCLYESAVRLAVGSAQPLSLRRGGELEGEQLRRPGQLEQPQDRRRLRRGRDSVHPSVAESACAPTRRPSE